MDAWVTEIIDSMVASRFRDLSGANVAASIPASAALVNQLVARAVAARTGAPVRSIVVHPRAGDAFDALVTLTLELVPPLKVEFTIERQPRFPDDRTLLLGWSFLGGAGALASRFLSSNVVLPPGLRLDGSRLLVDVGTLISQTPAAPVLPYLTKLELHTAEDRVIVDVELRTP